MTQFVINKATGNFATSLGKFHLKPGEAKPVTDQELLDEELSYAITLGLLELSDSPNVIVENPPLGEFNLDTSLVAKTVVDTPPVAIESTVVKSEVEAPVATEPVAVAPSVEEPSVETVVSEETVETSTKTSRKKAS